jgi:HEAT repeat protein
VNTMSTRSNALRVLSALVLLLAPIAAQTPPTTLPPVPGPHAGVPALPARRLPKRDEDLSRWEKWWELNKEDFLVPRAILAPDRAGDQYAGTLGAPLEAEIRATVIPALLDALKEGDHQTRAPAAIALGKAGDWREIRTLAAALNDRERAVAEAATLALGLFGEASVEPPLRDLMNDATRSSRERGLAAIALGYSGGDLARSVLFRDLGATSDAEGHARIASLEADLVLAAALWAGADKRDGNGDRAPLAASNIQKALSVSTVKDRQVLGIGTAALSKTRDPGSLLFVLKGIADPKADVRTGAGIAAGRVMKADDRKSVIALINAMSSEAEQMPRRMMLISLGRIGGPDARKRLVAELDAGQRQDRAFAALALGISGASDLAPRIRKEFEGASDDTLKGACAIALGLMHDPEAFRLVADAVRTKGNPELLRHLAWFFALDRGRGSAAILETILAESRIADVQDAAAVALGLIGSLESQNVLIKHLGAGASVSIRSAAAIGLARMGDRRGVAPLLKTLKNTAEQATVRGAAATALGILCQKNPWPPFARVTIDSNYDIENEAIDRIKDLL